MRHGIRISAIIPALDEERAIGRVLDDIPGWVDEVLVVDNGSSDGTARVAAAHGARVLHQPRRGYGSACLLAMAHLDDPGVVVFLDGDHSDHPEQMASLVDPVIRGEVDLMIGSRSRGRRERGALTPQALYGNYLACALLRLLWGGRCSDIGPFRAISRQALDSLGMADPDYGWTMEMQVKAARAGLRVGEVPVRYRRRIGQSKVSGTVKGVVMASYKTLWTIFRIAAER